MKIDMTIKEWFELVKKTLADNPDWLMATNQAITAGIKDRLDEEITARANAETSLIVCFEAAGGTKELPEQHRQMVKTAIKQSKLVAGTAYADNI